MSIKKSSLEKKWYYRLAKIFFIALGIVIALLLFLQKRVYVCYQPQPSDFNLLVFILIGLFLYFLLLCLIWRTFLYIAFGGLEDDIRKDDQKKSVISSVEKLSSPNKQKTELALIIPWIIFVIIMTIMILASTGLITLPKIKLNQGNTNVTNYSGYKCPATSAQTSTPCHSVQGDVGVFGVIVPVSCPCPSDTTFSQMDNITAGGPYRICVCK